MPRTEHQLDTDRHGHAVWTLHLVALTATAVVAAEAEVAVEADVADVVGMAVTTEVSSLEEAILSSGAEGPSSRRGRTAPSPALRSMMASRKARSSRRAAAARRAARRTLGGFASRLALLWRVAPSRSLSAQLFDLEVAIGSYCLLSVGL
jgi:hypothetical protein